MPNKTIYVSKANLPLWRLAKKQSKQSISSLFSKFLRKRFRVKGCVNGVTQEALLAIVIDRLRSFQAGPFACDENGEALDYCGYALAALQKRTLARIARGVEGTTQK